MTHPDLPPDRQRALREALTGDTEPPEPAPPPDETGAAPPSSRAGAPWRARVRTRVKEAARPVADPALDRLAELVAGRLRHTLRSEYDELAADVALVRAQLHASGAAVLALSGIAEGPELLLEARDALVRLRAVEINLELMKGELAAFRDSLDDLGRAIAPGAGLEGVPVRFAELRERVNTIDRRLREIASGELSRSTEAAAARATVASATGGATRPGAGSGFDYVGFEQRFRGESEAVVRTLSDRYLDLLRDHQPVLDLGCGRGELLAALRDAGIDAEGVELDAGMASEARARGLTVHEGDAVSFLRGAPPQRFGSITAIHVVEHLEIGTLVELLELAASRLTPGGVLIAETPNPASLIVLGNSYVLDPTHVWPLHPSLLTFLCERAGFRDVRLEFHEPARAYHLAPIDAGPDAPEWVTELNARLERLNEVLFGPQEYAAIATTPA